MLHIDAYKSVALKNNLTSCSCQVSSCFAKEKRILFVNKTYFANANLNEMNEEKQTRIHLLQRK